MKDWELQGFFTGKNHSGKAGSRDILTTYLSTLHIHYSQFPLPPLGSLEIHLLQSSPVMYQRFHNRRLLSYSILPSVTQGEIPLPAYMRV
jgi:hypothetical protein